MNNIDIYVGAYYNVPGYNIYLMAQSYVNDFVWKQVQTMIVEFVLYITYHMSILHWLMNNNNNNGFSTSP